jgi:hypothetical protein
MKSYRVCSGLPTAARRFVSYGLSFALAIAVALPEQLPAASVVNMASTQFQSSPSVPGATDLILVHCCHAHPLPPYDAYCCHSGAAYGGYYGGYYGPAGVVGTSRRVARRTSRRVSRRR